MRNVPVPQWLFFLKNWQRLWLFLYGLYQFMQIYIYRKCMYQIITYNCPTTFQVEQESTTSSLGLFVRQFTFLGKILSGSNLNWRFSDIQPTDFILAWAVGPTIKTRSLIFFLFWPAVCMLVVHCRNPWHKIASSTR